MEKPRLDYLVLDSGAIIRGHGLNLFGEAKVIVTVAEVMSEIRDSKARELLAKLPFPIEERTPSVEAMKTGLSYVLIIIFTCYVLWLLSVYDFAKKTGDFAALSKTDLKLISLTYMLEKEFRKVRLSHTSILSIQ